MAALSFFAACTHDLMSASHSVLNSSFIDRHSKLFFKRTPCLNISRRRLSVRNVASDQKQKAKEPKADEEGALLQIFV